MTGAPNSPIAVIEHALASLAGKRVLDVGCATGTLAQALAARGAAVAGIDPNAEAIAEAKRLVPSGDFRRAGAERMPFDDRSFDAVVIVNALHHVPIPAMDRALDEMARVTKLDGRLIVLEPLAHGSFFDVLKIVDDETHVRAEAQRALARSVEQGRLGLDQTITFVRTDVFADIDGFLARIVAVDPARQAIVEEMRGAIAAAVQRVAPSGPHGRIALDQPVKADILRIAARARP